MRLATRVALVGLGALAASLALGAAVWLSGVEVPAEFLREPLERALSSALRAPTRIEGPLRLQTGLAATVSADALVIADPFAADATLARGLRPAARIDLIALLQRTVRLEEVAGDELQLTLVRHASGPANWMPLFTAPPGGRAASFSFGGIERLRIGRVTGSHQRDGLDPVPFTITEFDGALPRHELIAARGKTQINSQPMAFDLRSASLADFAGATTVPLQGSVEWAGLRVEFSGQLARDGTGFDGDIHAMADDASLPLAALGIEAGQPGRLDLRTPLVLSATEAAARDLTLRLGANTVAGRASVEWSASRPGLTADLGSERIDLEPFLSARELPKDRTLAEMLIEALESTAIRTDAELRLTVGELAGLPVAMQAVKVEATSRDGLVTARGGALVAGTQVASRIDYDARKPQRTLAAQVEGGGASIAALPDTARPRALSGSAAALRGRLQGRGSDARAIVASLQGELEARNLRWSFRRQSGETVSGRFHRVRLAVQGTRALTAELSGTLGDGACTLKLDGGAIAPLLDGTPWPLQLAAACPGERISARGQLALAPLRLAGEWSFDAAAERIGPVAKALGVAPVAPYPLAARGTLALDEKVAVVRLAALRFGRSRGSGEIALPIGADGAARVQLALTTLDLDEISATDHGAPAPADLFEREVLRRDLRLPDMQFDLAAERITYADAGLRRVRADGDVRSRRVVQAQYRFEWDGIPLSGRLNADFGGRAPRIQLEVRAQKADLTPLLARLDLPDIALRTESLSLRGRSEGVTLGELLARATLRANLDGGRLGKRGAAPSAARAEFSARLDAAPGQPLTLAARGAFDGEPMELAAEVAETAGLARAGTTLPLNLRLALGDTQVEAAGQITRDGTGDGRLQVSGQRLDRLGRLLGVELPEIGPYSANAMVAATAAGVHATDLNASIGRSRLSGELQFERDASGRPGYRAVLRAPALHLEDIGADQWVQQRAVEDTPREAPQGAATVDRALDWLRAADIDAVIDADALYSAGEPFAKGHLRARSDAGALRAEFHDVHAAGGRLDAELSVDATGETPKLSLRVQARDLDFGPLLRGLDPRSAMDGKLDLFADLVAQGPPAGLLPALVGTLDVAVYPIDLQPRALSLWGAGILSMLLQQLDPDSRSTVNCAVTSIDIERGVARSAAFFADTTRLRIVGVFEIDLASRALSGRIDPVSKTPQLLAIAPTMLLGGTVDSPRVTSAPANIVTVPLRFAASLNPFALDWRAFRGRAREGTDGCHEAYEQIRQGRSGTR